MTENGRKASIDAARRRGDAAHAGHVGDEQAARSFLGDADPEVRASALGAQPVGIKPRRCKCSGSRASITAIASSPDNATYKRDATRM